MRTFEYNSTPYILPPPDQQRDPETCHWRDFTPPLPGKPGRFRGRLFRRRSQFSAQHCEFTDPDLRAAAAGSYAVLADIATGLDWDKASAPGGQRRTEVMLWSLAHGYAQLSNAGLFGPTNSGAPYTSALFDIISIMPEFTYFPESLPGSTTKKC